MAPSDSVHIKEASVEETWRELQRDARAVLVDVRTKAEWAFVGVPDLSGLGKKLVAVEWQSFPDNRIDTGFADKLTAVLNMTGTGKEDAVFFICRSGGRSRMAAEVMAAHGFANCVNVVDGFEGPLNEDRHRGALAGWKFSALPWVQG